jgi:hypothetical protein
MGKNFIGETFSLPVFAFWNTGISERLKNRSINRSKTYPIEFEDAVKNIST